MRRAVLVCCPLLLVVEVYRRGYIGAVAFGCRQWTRATWRTEPEIIA